jgi:hypothetical protein
LRRRGDGGSGEPIKNSLRVLTVSGRSVDLRFPAV